MGYACSDHKTVRFFPLNVLKVVALTLMISISSLIGLALGDPIVPIIPDDPDLFPDAVIQVNPKEVDLGGCSELTWKVTNGEGALIDHGIGSVDLTGSISVCPEENTTYTLKAFNGTYFTLDYDTLVVAESKVVESVINDGEGVSEIKISDFSISNVVDGDRVPQIMTIIGDCPLDLEEDIWLFVISPNGLYYPQSPDACNASWSTPKIGGRWEARVGLGQPGDVGEYFGIVLTVADQNASREISDALRLWCNEGVYTGWKRLPPGVMEIQRITVIRNADIWAPAPNISNANLRGDVSFSNISEDDPVPFQMKIDGNCTRDHEGDIWVLVYPTNARWYPQSINPESGVHTLEANGTWRTMGTFGGVDSNIGEPFDVVVVLANDTASKKFAEKQREWSETEPPYYPGLLTIELPQGIEEKDRVRVYRG